MKDVFKKDREKCLVIEDIYVALGSATIPNVIAKINYPVNSQSLVLTTRLIKHSVYMNTDKIKVIDELIFSEVENNNRINFLYILEDWPYFK